jgi:hypothetical protein
MPIGFRFLLITPDSDPVDPAVFLCAEPRGSVGDVLTLRRGRRYRILDVRPPSTAAGMADITAIWTVTRGLSGRTVRAVCSAWYVVELKNQ